MGIKRFDLIQDAERRDSWMEECYGGKYALASDYDALAAQLPEGMKHCTIQFIECPVGHGRLTATNWVQHGCDTCRIRALEAAARMAHEALKAVWIKTGEGLEGLKYIEGTLGLTKETKGEVSGHNDPA